MNHRFKYIVLLLMCVAMSACKPPADNKPSDRKVKNELKYAERLRMYKERGYTVVEILDDSPSANVESSFILLPKKVSAPAADPNVMVIPTPINKALVYTSVHAGGLTELGHPSIVAGVADAEYFKLPEIRAGLESGAIRDIGHSSSPSAEKIIELAPQVIIVNQYQGADYHAIDNLGIPLIKMAENFEQTPLGRAEWIKLLGELIGERQKADSIFNAVEKRYNELAQQGKSMVERPKVLTETMYEGVWNVPGGKSYQANLLKDAGGIYPWQDVKQSGSLPLSFEQVLEKGADADVWLMNVFGYELTDKALLELDNRYRHFAPFTSGNVWYCNTAEKPIYEETPYHPDLLLADYIGILAGNTDNLRYFSRMIKK